MVASKSIPSQLEISYISPTHENTNPEIPLFIENSKQFKSVNEFTNQISSKIKVVNKSNNPLPKYAHEVGDSGVDLMAYIEDGIAIKIAPKEVKMVHTGLYVSTPVGMEIQIRPRSGLGKRRINIANCVGTIDASYRGELCLLIYNFGEEPFFVNNGDKLCQGVLAPVYRIVWEEVEELDQTVRGEGGFGHTGVSK